MPKLLWDQTNERVYETGVEQGAIYVMGDDSEYGNGAAWNGLTAVTESPSGAEATPLYANNNKYAELTSNEEFGATIEAYTYPDEFAICDGSAELGTGVKIGQQPRKPFCLVYKTLVGNDTEGTDHGYKLHIVYNCKAAPSEKAYATVNDSPEAITFSWEITTTPEKVTGHKPTAHIEIDSTKFTAENKAKLTEIENALYGTDDTEPKILMPDEIAAILTGTDAGEEEQTA